MKAVNGIIYGRVQGVGFRMYAYRQANRLGLYGWVKNCNDGSVSFHCEGSDVDIDYFVRLMERGNDFSVVERVETEQTTTEYCTSFEVVV